MFNQWIKGNAPDHNGDYWVTAKEINGETIYTYPYPVSYFNGDWIIRGGIRFNEKYILAYMDCPIPRPYIPDGNGKTIF